MLLRKQLVAAQLEALEGVDTGSPPATLMPMSRMTFYLFAPAFVGRLPAAGRVALGTCDSWASSPVAADSPPHPPTHLVVTQSEGGEDSCRKCAECVVPPRL